MSSEAPRRTRDLFDVIHHQSRRFLSLRRDAGRTITESDSLTQRRHKELWSSYLDRVGFGVLAQPFILGDLSETGTVPSRRGQERADQGSTLRRDIGRKGPYRVPLDVGHGVTHTAWMLWILEQHSGDDAEPLARLRSHFEGIGPRDQEVERNAYAPHVDGGRIVSGSLLRFRLVRCPQHLGRHVIRRADPRTRRVRHRSAGDRNRARACWPDRGASTARSRRSSDSASSSPPCSSPASDRDGSMPSRA